VFEATRWLSTFTPMMGIRFRLSWRRNPCDQHFYADDRQLPADLGLNWRRNPWDRHFAADDRQLPADLGLN